MDGEIEVRPLEKGRGWQAFGLGMGLAGLTGLVLWAGTVLPNATVGDPLSGLPAECTGVWRCAGEEDREVGSDAIAELRGRVRHRTHPTLNPLDVLLHREDPAHVSDMPLTVQIYTRDRPRGQGAPAVIYMQRDRRVWLLWGGRTQLRSAGYGHEEVRVRR